MHAYLIYEVSFPYALLDGMDELPNAHWQKHVAQMYQFVALQLIAAFAACYTAD